jgi:hypothetical protein
MSHDLYNAYSLEAIAESRSHQPQLPISALTGGGFGKLHCHQNIILIRDRGRLKFKIH